jgi:predicted dehydrogenase
MGWYHAKQIIDGDCPSAHLTDVVEPWFLGLGFGDPSAGAFRAFQHAHEGQVKFHTSVGAMKMPVAGTKKLAIISGRTADNPRLLKECVERGCSHVYLEKPGAPSVGELEAMASYAKARGVGVSMGFNKNVAPYVAAALAAERGAGPGAKTSFIHNNAYTKDQLGECFERNREGMLKNMAIHELALLATFYGVTADNLASVVADPAYSSVQTLGGITDFDKLCFTVTTTEGRTVSVFADRCGDAGGQGFSEAVVTDAGGKVVLRSVTPDEALKRQVDAQQKEHPGWMPYFFLQHGDYITLKERVCRSMLDGTAPEGVASIDVAIEALKLAEMLTPTLQQQLVGQTAETHAA